MNLGDFLTPEAGQRRRAWLDDKMSSADEAMRYYLGPTGVPDKLKAVTEALNYTDAGDMVAAGDASRTMWNNPSVGNAAQLAAAGGALALPLYSARMGEGLADLADEAVRAYNPNVVNSNPMGKAAPQKGIRAYHGSPHSFDRFQMDKIGTGEGAQAYGHGLYFAEAEDVARSYKDALSGNDPASLHAALYNMDDVPEHIKDSAFNYQSDPNADRLLRYLENTDPALAQRMRDRLGGSMYEVNINANADDFLDWDAPLHQQPKVAERLGTSAEDIAAYKNVSSRYDDALLRALDGDAAAEAEASALLKEMNAIEAKGVNRYGSEIAKGNSVFDRPQDAIASQRMREAGIPGIKYRDAGSRGTQEGTRNFVVFDENLIDIVRKYGIAGAAAMLGVSAMDVESAMAGGDSGEAPNMSGVLGMPSQGALRDYLNQQPKDTR